MFRNSNQIDKTSFVPLYAQLEQVMKAEIENGYLLAGDMLPSEQEVMEYHQLSRTTVRQAIADLVNEGLLYKKKGVGTFVAKPKMDLQYMGSMISYNEQIRAMGLEPSTKVLKLECVEASGELCKQMGLDNGKRVIELVRLRYADEEPMAVVFSYLPYELCASILDEDLEQESLYSILARNESSKVVRVHRTVEAKIASSEDCKYLGIDRGFPVQSFLNMAYNKDEQMIEYCKSRYRGDRSQFCVELKI